jgi:23S rRNA G2445 N2-methylase RlmL
VGHAQVPEQRIADVWNKYVREIGASEEALVTAAEIHSMRDATFATAEMMWSRGTNQSAWTMPNIFAVGADGKVAEGCRAVEALRVIHDLDQLFDNLRGARERLRQGIVASDAIKKSLENTNANQKTTGRLVALARVNTNPLRPAEYRYVSEHGTDHLNQVVEMLFEELFPSN